MTRGLTDPPNKVQASRKFIFEVGTELDIEEPERTRIADYIAQKIEDVGGTTAQPVFNMAGTGPNCSWCGTIWPLCGHNHTSECLGDSDSEETS